MQSTPPRSGSGACGRRWLSQQLAVHHAGTWIPHIGTDAHSLAGVRASSDPSPSVYHTDGRSPQLALRLRVQLVCQAHGIGRQGHVQRSGVSLRVLLTTPLFGHHPLELHRSTFRFGQRYTPHLHFSPVEGPRNPSRFQTSASQNVCVSEGPKSVPWRPGRSAARR